MAIVKKRLMDGSDAESNQIYPETSVSALVSSNVGKILATTTGGVAEATLSKGGTPLTPDANMVIDVPVDITRADATTLQPGDDATATIDANHVLRLGIPKGDDGHNPNLGTYVYDGSTYTPTLPGEPSVLSDYIVVLDKSVNPVTSKIWTWDSTLSTPAWADTGRDANQAYFGSGELLSDVRIDDTHLINPASNSLTKASDSKNLRDALIETTYEPMTLENYQSGEFIRSDGSIFTGELWTIRQCEVTPGRKYRFNGKYRVIYTVSTNVFMVNYYSEGEHGTSTYLGHDPRFHGAGDFELVEYVNQIIIPPTGAKYVCFNTITTQPQDFTLDEVIEDIVDVPQMKADVDELKNNVTTLEASVNDIEQNVGEISEALTHYTRTPVVGVEVTDYYISALVGETISEGKIGNENYSYQVFNVDETLSYSVSMKSSSPTGIWHCYFADSNGIVVGRTLQGIYGSTQEWVDLPIVLPEGTTNVYLAYYKPDKSFVALKQVTRSYVNVDELSEEVSALESSSVVIWHEINEINDALKYTTKTPVDGTEVTDYWISANVGDSISEGLRESESYSYQVFDVDESKPYSVWMKSSPVTSIYHCYFANSSGIVLGRTLKGVYQETNTWTDFPLELPQGTANIYLVYYKPDKSFVALKELSSGYVNVNELKEEVEQLSDDVEDLKLSTGQKLMKVVINQLTGLEVSNAFYIRTEFNKNKDIIITHRINGNGLVSFLGSYIGSKTLTDAQLMTSTYRFATCSDSTGPICESESYWGLFAQHGYCIPIVNNSVNMTVSDIGAVWKDQLDRVFTVGKVSASTIYLLPEIKLENGHYVRDWSHKSNYTNDILSLEYVSGGNTGHVVGNFTVEGFNNFQIRPVVDFENRKWMVDGIEITEPGTYHCNNFSVSDTEIGYDPATVQTWFGTDDKPDLSEAQPLARFTYSFNYIGAQCCVNTTINLLREYEFGWYGGTQQQFFGNDNGNYTAKFMLPKAKNYSGSPVFEKPFTLSRQYTFYRQDTNLKDVNNLMDRCIGFLENENNGEFFGGMAAGLSLVSGNTVNAKRIQDIKLCSNVSNSINPYDINRRNLLSLFGPVSGINKFYIAAINTGKYEDNDYYIEPPYFREINYYVSYFDPAENVGQVYWYKDGNSYVIYCHAQEASNGAIAINVPEFMEGLNLTIVEKTDDASLVSETITNGKFYIEYTGVGQAKYIVLKVQ